MKEARSCSPRHESHKHESKKSFHCQFGSTEKETKTMTHPHLPQSSNSPHLHKTDQVPHRMMTQHNPQNSLKILSQTQSNTKKTMTMQMQMTRQNSVMLSLSIQSMRTEQNTMRQQTGQQLVLFPDLKQPALLSSVMCEMRCKLTRRTESLHPPCSSETQQSVQSLMTFVEPSLSTLFHSLVTRPIHNQFQLLIVHQ
ncbi:hypothetical protein BLNAU_19462 [Blattamonas nauphoetae]|uniref:Uncharacterized protein n=1 Tax=Blattamonas nauphoetae TaxID=2049346 RepID=A0ABQ9X1N9_9EUKA|nr:hypothetical protein BLNAU_19462 [Blattamonas nauphoetae]